LTGHDDGRIVIALAEADDAEREKRRNAMGEPYRTLLGHFRHEIGHYYWDRLVRDRGRLQACRAVFGDDTADYAKALERHYREGGPENWQEHYVSQYATTHAWEDFAETWAHYLHIVDTMEMAAAYQLGFNVLGGDHDRRARAEGDPYEGGDFAETIAVWMPLTVALNSINRCMGLADLYPFVLSPAVVRKLEFIHDLVHDRIPPDEQGSQEAQPDTHSGEQTGEPALSGKGRKIDNGEGSQPAFFAQAGLEIRDSGELGEPSSDSAAPT